MHLERTVLIRRCRELDVPLADVTSGDRAELLLKAWGVLLAAQYTLFAGTAET